MKKNLALIFLFYFCLAPFAPALQGNTAETIKQNMLKRLPRIQELKTQGLIGEDSQGWLAAVNGQLSAADKAIVDAENADRKSVYEVIARQQGTTVELVGKVRAKKIFERAKPGEYLKQEDGSWSRK